MTIVEKQLTEVVQQAMSETFEGMAFIVITPSDRDKQDHSEVDEWIWAKVSVKEPVEGDFAIVFSRAVAEELTSTLFGTDESEGLDKLDDVLKEIVNTMAGRCMNSLIPEDQAFALSLPDIGNGWPGEENSMIYKFNTDEGKPLAAIVDLPLDTMGNTAN